MSGNPSSRANRARLGAVGFTIIAVLLALAAAFFLARLMKGRGYDQDAMIKIVIASQDLSPGVSLAEKDVSLKMWPVKSVPAGAFRSTKKLMASKHRVPLHTILKGEPILASRLSEESKGSGMAPLVPNNMRAFPVRIPRWVAASKMLYPGAVVDVLTTVKLDGLRLTSKTVLQKVTVVAVNGAVDGVAFSRPTGSKKKKLSSRNRTSVVTLLLTPQQAEDMAIAVRAGKIDLVLRGASDEEMVDTRGANTNALFGHGVVTPEGEEANAGGADGQSQRARRAPARRPRRGPVRRRPSRRAVRKPAPAPRRKSSGSSIIVGGEQ